MPAARAAGSVTSRMPPTRDEQSDQQHFAEEGEGAGRTGEAHRGALLEDRPCTREVGPAGRLLFASAHEGAHGQPFSPCVATPSTRKRWKTRKNSSTGRSAMNDAVTVAP